MAKIKFSDLEMYYEIHGEGQPLVLIAGYSCDHTYWGVILDLLTPFYKVLIFDNRACGQTKDLGKPFAIETLADDVMNLCDALNIHNPHILGQSMGGAIAQTIAIRFPQQINKLIILNSTVKFSAASYVALNSLIQLRALGVPLDNVIDACLPWIFSSAFLADPLNIQAFHDIVNNDPYLQSVPNQQRQLAAIKNFDASGWQDKIHQPTLVIAAEEDVLTPVFQVQALANNIPNSRFEIVGGGHASPIEQAKPVSELILSFLKNTS